MKFNEVFIFHLLMMFNFFCFGIECAPCVITSDNAFVTEDDIVIIDVTVLVICDFKSDVTSVNVTRFDEFICHVMWTQIHAF